MRCSDYGVQPPDRIEAGDLHQGTFDVDESAIAIGVRLLVAAAVSDLAQVARRSRPADFRKNRSGWRCADHAGLEGVTPWRVAELCAWAGFQREARPGQRIVDKRLNTPATSRPYGVTVTL